MTSRTNPAFWVEYRRLPRNIKRAARKAFRVFQDDPNHHRLRFKAVAGKPNIYSVRISIGYRALGMMPRPDEIVRFWIGTHAKYNHLISK